MDQIERDHTANGNVSDTDGSQTNVAQEQFAAVQDTNTSMIQATVVQSPQHFSQTAVSVIQPAQASVIQTATSSAQQIQIPQAIHFQGVIDQDDDLDEEGKKRRDILSRRPSYRYFALKVRFHCFSESQNWEKQDFLLYKIILYNFGCFHASQQVYDACNDAI
jgi:hypothetical protein